MRTGGWGGGGGEAAHADATQGEAAHADATQGEAAQGAWLSACAWTFERTCSRLSVHQQLPSALTPGIACVVSGRNMNDETTLPPVPSRALGQSRSPARLSCVKRPPYLSHSSFCVSMRTSTMSKRDSSGDASATLSDTDCVGSYLPLGLVAASTVHRVLSLHTRPAYTRQAAPRSGTASHSQRKRHHG